MAKDMIYIGSDHAGFKLKKDIVDYLNKKGFGRIDESIACPKKKLEQKRLS
jgi:ribose 5-phosphate isomerase RpiB